MSRSEEDTQDKERGEAGRYWNAHPIATDGVPFERGTRESFDAIVANWERDMKPRRRAFLDSCRGKRLLEIGCGIGVDGRYFNSIGADYQAVDMSRESLKLAKRHFEMNDLPVRITNGDATRNACRASFARPMRSVARTASGSSCRSRRANQPPERRSAFQRFAISAIKPKSSTGLAGSPLPPLNSR
ncbi:MAG: class I SAM-dependent methyltransferase [Myxococcota bacterium]|jgi:SAM-dependent methyltransferase|nr:class I SAM-dependent methyltransferase [Myxococcota bacterium]